MEAMTQLPLPIFKEIDLPNPNYQPPKPKKRRHYNFSWMPWEQRKKVEELYPIWFNFSQTTFSFIKRSQVSGTKIAGQKRKLFNGRQKAPCFYCGRLLIFKKATMDHVVPRSFGGSNRLENLLIACKKCNGARQNMSFDKWMDKLGMANLIDLVLRRRQPN